ncbi:hypothetical protein WQE_35290 [Paraburkholderia hospita]|uniref:Uncharacterized protein n=1 Tax=Paraburkholderia hospita TaxID=169430 RepID=A0ABN0FC10_9BURK|nr:hypothetical protein WQE_35290 [Paraburkholderia hospita]
MKKHAQVSRWTVIFEISEGIADVGGSGLVELAFFQIDVVKWINRFRGMVHFVFNVGSLFRSMGN